MLGPFSNGQTSGVVVVLPDGTRCGLPGWMLDAQHCTGLMDAHSPRIALAALLAIRRLIDAQDLPTDSPAGSAEACSSEGAGHGKDRKRPVNRTL